MIQEQTPPKEELRDAFGAFAQIAGRLQSAYENLQESASKLDRDLADANERLHHQVEELENLSGSLAAVLRAIPCGVVVASKSGTVLMLNPAAESILGVPGEQLIGQQAGSHRDQAGAPLLLLADGPGEVQERMLETRNGVRIIDGGVVAVTDQSGAELGLVEVLNDRSEVKALQLEVERLDRLAELGRVAAIIAHEIRNPLSGIRGFAGMLERQLADSEEMAPGLRWCQRIIEGVERADAIIDSVLFLARPKSSDQRHIQVESLLCDTFEAAAQADPARARGVRVSLDVSPAELLVLGDETRLRQALTNLIQNALESLGGTGRLDLLGRQVGDEVQFIVRDDGPGVPQQARERLFEPFFTTKTEGAGLGLALVQRIAQLHAGRVTLEEGRDGGAGFVFALPVAAVPEESCVS